MTVESLPSFEGATPAKTVITTLRLLTPPSDAAVHFLRLASTETLRARMAHILDHVRTLPAFASRLETSAALSELLVAAARTYIDVEHGASSNAYWMQVIATSGGPIEQAVNKLIPPCLRDEAELAAALGKTKSVQGFDGETFASLVREVWASERHVKHRGDWF